MFDDDDDEGDTPVEGSMFRRKDDYGGGLDDQRTNQDEMDQLMKPCLDFDDDDEEDDELLEDDQGGVLHGGNSGLKPKLTISENDDNLEKYFSNGDVDRGHIENKDESSNEHKAVFSKRNGRNQPTGRVKRYNNSDQDDDFDDDEDDELERGGDPLSLDELNGWMNQING